MGTRNQINVILDGKKVLSQYGQWDGYLSGVGNDIVKFFDKKIDIDLLKQKFRSYVILSDHTEGLWDAALNREVGDGVSFPEGDLFKKVFPLCSRDTGADCLDIVYQANQPMIAANNEDLSWSEYRYDIDLDKMKLTIYTSHVNGYDLEKKPFAEIDIDDRMGFPIRQLEYLIDVSDCVFVNKSMTKSELKKNINELSLDRIREHIDKADNNIKEYLIRALSYVVLNKNSKKKSTKKTSTKIVTKKKLTDLQWLGLKRTPQTLAQLKQARKEAMKKYHPDLGGTDYEAQEVNKAYNNLRKKMS